MAQCAAKSKRSGERCKKDAVPGRSVCHMHGGKSLVGAAVHTYKDGRYSKLLPARLVSNYERAAHDSDLLVLREDIALVDARLADLLCRVDSGESGEAWKRAKAALRLMQDGLAANDRDRATSGMMDLDSIIKEGLEDHHAWVEVGELLDRRERLVRSERRRMVELQQMITAEQALMLIAALTNSVRLHVTDPDALRAISADIARLTAASTRTGVDG